MTHTPLSPQPESGSPLRDTVVNSLRVGLGLSGLVAVIIGIIVLVMPQATLTAIALLFGIYFLIAGVVNVAIGIFARSLSAFARILDVVFGIMLIIVGVVAMKNVEMTLLALIIVLGIGWIVEGVLALVAASETPAPGVAVAMGIMSILAGIVVLVLPLASLGALVIVSGISLVILGVAQLVRAFALGRRR